MRRIVGLIIRYLDRFVDLHEGLQVGKGCSYSKENLDGICPQLIKMGSNVVVAPKAVILTHDASLLIKTRGYFIRETIIGDNVFIGYGAVIMPGVTIGADSVVGSNTVVTKDVPPGVVICGNPGRIIGDVELLHRKRMGNLIVLPDEIAMPMRRSQILVVQKFLIEQFRKGSIE